VAGIEVAEVVEVAELVEVVEFAGIVNAFGRRNTKIKEKNFLRGKTTSIPTA